jgi:ABC-type cobalamin transport system permease subunit
MFLLWTSFSSFYFTLRFIFTLRFTILETIIRNQSVHCLLILLLLLPRNPLFNVSPNIYISIAFKKIVSMLFILFSYFSLNTVFRTKVYWHVSISFTHSFSLSWRSTMLGLSILSVIDTWIASNSVPPKQCCD